METTDDLQLIERHVAAFNEGVRTGDWEPMLANFVPDAELHFPGVGFSGLGEIRAAYREQPPDDTIALLEVRGRVASFRWTHGGTGTMAFELAGGRVMRLTVGFDEG